MNPSLFRAPPPSHVRFPANVDVTWDKSQEDRLIHDCGLQPLEMDQAGPLEMDQAGRDDQSALPGLCGPFSSNALSTASGRLGDSCGASAPTMGKERMQVMQRVNTTSPEGEHSPQQASQQQPPWSVYTKSSKGEFYGVRTCSRSCLRTRQLLRAPRRWCSVRTAHAVRGCLSAGHPDQRPGQQHDVRSGARAATEPLIRPHRGRHAGGRRRHGGV